MATISDLKKIKPSWEKASLLEVTDDGIEIKALKNEKRIFAIKDKQKNLSKKQYNRFLHTCRKNAIQYFIDIFDIEPFCELWSYSHKSKIILEARVPNLLKNKVDELKSQLQTEEPDGYAVILSFKDNNPKGIEEHEKFVHRTVRTLNNDAFLTVEPDTVGNIYLEMLSKLIPPDETRSVLWDAHEAEGLKKLANKLQYMPRIVYFRAIDLARKRSSKKEVKNHKIPIIVNYAETLTDNRDQEVIIDPRIQDEKNLKLEDICYHRELKNFVDQLTDRQQQVIKLRYWEDLSLTKTAEKLGIAIKTVSDIEKPAIKKLKYLLKIDKFLIINL